MNLQRTRLYYGMIMLALLGGVAAYTYYRSSWASDFTYTSVTPKQADEFVDSIGVNVHLGYTAYKPSNTYTLDALKNLGVRHTRDTLSWPDAYNVINADQDVREQVGLTLTFNARGKETVEEYQSYWQSRISSVTGSYANVEAIEMPNEADKCGGVFCGAIVPNPDTASAVTCVDAIATQTTAQGAVVPKEYDSETCATWEKKGGLNWWSNYLESAKFMRQTVNTANQARATQNRPKILIYGPTFSHIRSHETYTIPGNPTKTYAQSIREDIYQNPDINPDYGNNHTYCRIGGPAWVQADPPITSWDWDACLASVREQAFAAYAAPKQIIHTENGYASSMPGCDYLSDQACGSKENIATYETMQDKYIQRMFFKSFDRGVKRTYVYELMEQVHHTAPITTSAGVVNVWANYFSHAEERFGLVRSDPKEICTANSLDSTTCANVTAAINSSDPARKNVELVSKYNKKPAFDTVQNLVALLSDKGPGFTPSALSYSLVEQPGTQGVKHTLLQKRNGEYYLVLRNENEVAFSAETNAALAVCQDATKTHPNNTYDCIERLKTKEYVKEHAIQSRIGFAQPVNVSVYDPSDSLDEKRSYQAVTELDLSIPDRLLILKINKVGPTVSSTLKARTADSFVDSIGVNTHFSYLSYLANPKWLVETEQTAADGSKYAFVRPQNASGQNVQYYSQSPNNEHYLKVMARLQESGIRYIRDNVEYNPMPQYWPLPTIDDATKLRLNDRYAYNPVHTDDSGKTVGTANEGQSFKEAVRKLSQLQNEVITIGSDGTVTHRAKTPEEKAKSPSIRPELLVSQAYAKGLSYRCGLSWDSATGYFKDSTPEKEACLANEYGKVLKNRLADMLDENGGGLIDHLELASVEGSNENDLRTGQKWNTIDRTKAQEGAAAYWSQYGCSTTAAPTNYESFLWDTKHMNPLWYQFNYYNGTERLYPVKDADAPNGLGHLNYLEDSTATIMKSLKELNITDPTKPLVPFVAPSLSYLGFYDGSGAATSGRPATHMKPLRYGCADQATNTIGPVETDDGRENSANLLALVEKLYKNVSYGNVHAYCQIGWGADCLADGQAKINLPLYNDRLIPLSMEKGLYATENGYATNPARDILNTSVPAMYDGLPDNRRTAGVQNKYNIQTLWGNFDRGVNRTFLYEFLDEGIFEHNIIGEGLNNAPKPEEYVSSWEPHYGIVRTDLSPKPSFTTIKNTIDILEDPGDSFATGSIAVNITGERSGSVKPTLLQKRNGSYYLVLRNEDASLPKPNQSTGEIDHTLPVTVSFPGTSWNIKSYYPATSSLPDRVGYNASSFAVDVPETTVILRLDPPGTRQAYSDVYGGPLPALPATIEAEQYDLGGEGVSYHTPADGTQGTTGLMGIERASAASFTHDASDTFRRGEGVETVPCSEGDSTCIAIAGLRNGSWIEYSVEVPESGVYDVTVHALPESGGTVQVETDGPRVDGYQSTVRGGLAADPAQWRDLVIRGLFIPSGRRIIRVSIATATGATFGLIDRIGFSSGEPMPPTLKIESDLNGASYVLPDPQSGTSALLNIKGTVVDYDSSIVMGRVFLRGEPKPAERTNNILFGGVVNDAGLVPGARLSTAFNFDWKTMWGLSEFKPGTYRVWAEARDMEQCPADVNRDCSDPRFAPSSPKDATVTFLHSPAGMTVRAVGTTGAELSWSKASNALGYRIETSSSENEGFAVAAEVSASVDSVSLQDLPAVPTRYYRLSARVPSISQAGVKGEARSTAATASTTQDMGSKDVTAPPSPSPSPSPAASPQSVAKGSSPSPRTPGKATGETADSPEGNPDGGQVPQASPAPSAGNGRGSISTWSLKVPFTSLSLYTVTVNDPDTVSKAAVYVDGKLRVERSYAKGFKQTLFVLAPADASVHTVLVDGKGKVTGSPR